MLLTRLAQVARQTPTVLRSSATLQHRASSGGQHYNAPSGYLFGEKPPAAGEKRVKGDWEDIYYWGMGGGMALGAVLIYFKPDTSLESWAQKEAIARMEAKGETPTYTKS